MNIAGFQKLSLIDYPEKICSIVFTQGCLFRCSYCHNPELVSIVKKTGINSEFIFNCIQDRRKFIDGVCITGGEPTLQYDLVEFIKAIKNLGLLVKLDTSGVNPKMVQTLIEKNLVDYIAMDIKNTWKKYDTVVHANNKNAITNCKTTMGIIQDSTIDHEFRTTVFPQVHKKEDFVEMAGYVNKWGKYFLQNIQYKKNLDKNIDKSKIINVKQIVLNLKKIYPYTLIEERI